MSLLGFMPWWVIPIAWVALWNWQRILGEILRKALVKISLTNSRAFKKWYENGYLVIYCDSDVIRFPERWDDILDA
jgi:hypothetical protein